MFAMDSELRWNFFNSDVGIGAIVRNKNGDAIIVTKCHFSMMAHVDLIEVIVMSNGLSQSP